MRDKVILVHGTFAASDQDQGERWWQRGSSFWQSLAARLQQSASLDESGRLFHWSGENSARARRKAAEALLSYFKRMEADLQPYHVVAHSHGGSVVFDALKLSRDKSKGRDRYVTLENLRSWTTIGTPFLQTCPSGSAVNLSWPIGNGLFNLGISVSLMGPVILFAGLTTIGASFLAVGLLLLFVGTPLVVSYFEQYEINREREFEIEAILHYGDRWLCIWSPDDEAINGLQASLLTSQAVLPRRQLSEPVFAGEKMARLVKPIALIVNDFYNAVMAPMADKFVWLQLGRLIQGNDRPGAMVRAVSAEASCVIGSCIPLDVTICTELRECADKAARDLAPQFRAVLGQLASGDPGVCKTGSIDWALSGNEFVHTSYFSNDNVQEIIALHIASSATSAVDHERGAERTQENLRWIKRSRDQATRNLRLNKDALISEIRRLKLTRGVRFVVQTILIFGATIAGLALFFGVFDILSALCSICT